MRSRVSRASAGSGASLGTAVSYSTAGGGSEAGGSQAGGGGSQIGWSRSETRLLMGLVDAEARSAADTLGGFMWDAVAAALRQRLKEDRKLAARATPQRRKGVDCRRRWDHVLKKAHATPKDRLTAEQKMWLVQFQAQRELAAGGGGGGAGPGPASASDKRARRKQLSAAIGTIPEEAPAREEV